MALTPEQIDAMAERIVHGAEERMVAELAERLCARLAGGVMGLAEEASLETLARSVRAEAERIVADHADSVSEDVRGNVRDALDGDAEAEWRAFAAVYGAEAAAAAAARFAGGATAHFAELSRQAAEGVAQIIARDNIAMAEHAADEWNRIAGEASDAYVLGLKPLREIMAEAVAEMAGAGISMVDYKSGVSTQPDVAVRRHAITQAGQAGGRMTIERCEAYGHELVVTSAHYGARPTHAVWQGKPCAIHGPAEVDGAFYPGLSELTGYGTVGGLKGANCRHMISPYFPGITRLPATEWPEHEAKFGMSGAEHYAATQRQRELERRIRKTKREIAAMEAQGVGLESPAYVQKRLVLGRQQKALREHCEKIGLVRQYDRERAYGVRSQPRALVSASRWRQKRITSTGRHPVTQQQIDDLIARDLPNVRLTMRPVYNPRLRTDGKTTYEEAFPGFNRILKVEIGPQSKSGDAWLRDTILHEELEARIIKRAGWRYESGDKAIHAYIDRVIAKYVKMKGL